MLCMHQQQTPLQAIADAKTDFDRIYAEVKEIHDLISIASSRHPLPENMPQEKEPLWIVDTLIDLKQEKKHIKTVWQLASTAGGKCPKKLVYKQIIPAIQDNIIMANKIYKILANLYKATKYNHTILKSGCEESC